MQIVRSHRKLRNVPRDAHERARAVIAILLHGVGRHARAVPVCECEQRVDDGRGAAGLEEDVRLFGLRQGNQMGNKNAYVCTRGWRTSDYSATPGSGLPSV